MLREIRASASRRSGERVQLARTHALVVKRKADSFPAARSAALKRIDALSSALSAHDPERTLARGYALVADREGAPVTSAATARERGDVVVRFADDAVGARIDPEPQRDGSDEHT
jgi:exodeoxyribonuclease VII large subunit